MMTPELEGKLVEAADLAVIAVVTMAAVEAVPSPLPAMVAADE